MTCTFWKIPRKTTTVEYYSKVEGLYLAILLKQDPTTSAFLKNFQNFRTAILINHRWMAASEFTDNSHNFYPFLTVPFVSWDEGWVE